MRRLAFVAVAVMLVLVGCGVGPEAEPRALPSEAAAAVDVPAVVPSGAAGRLLELWFVKDSRLVPVSRKTSAAVITAEDKIQGLEAGPTVTELAEGLRTAVTAVVPDVPLVATAESSEVPVELVPDQVAVVLSDEFPSLPSQEQILILGQVVLTLTTKPGTSVLFVNDNGIPVGVPLPSGRLSSGAVTSNDYQQLAS